MKMQTTTHDYCAEAFYGPDGHRVRMSRVYAENLDLEKFREGMAKEVALRPVREPYLFIHRRLAPRKERTA